MVVLKVSFTGKKVSFRSVFRLCVSFVHRASCSAFLRVKLVVFQVLLYARKSRLGLFSDHESLLSMSLLLSPFKIFKGQTSPLKRSCLTAEKSLSRCF